MIPLDPFGRSSLPASFDRADRVRLLREAADALLAGHLPPPAARLFLAGAVNAWLQGGERVGDLERVYLKVAAGRGSHATPQMLARHHDERRPPPDME